MSRSPVKEKTGLPLIPGERMGLPKIISNRDNFVVALGVILISESTSDIKFRLPS